MDKNQNKISGENNNSKNKKKMRNLHNDKNILIFKERNQNQTANI